MSEDGVIIAALSTFGSSLVVCYHGITVEKHYLSNHAPKYNVAYMLLSILPLFLLNNLMFLALLVWSVFGLIMVRDDERRKKRLVKYGFGSKTLGSIGLFIGLLSWNVTSTIFLNTAQFLINSATEVDSAGPTAGSYVVGFLLILGIVHLMGKIVTKKKRSTMPFST